MGNDCCCFDSKKYVYDEAQKRNYNSTTTNPVIKSAAVTDLKGDNLLGFEFNSDNQANSESNQLKVPRASTVQTPKQTTTSKRTNSWLPKTGQIRAVSVPKYSQDQLDALKKLRAQMPQTPQSLATINKCAGPMASFVSERSLRSFSTRRQQNKIGSNPVSAMEQIRAQRRRMMQRVSQDILLERKKDAERLAKMQLIMIDNEHVIQEDDNASINDADEDTESKKQSNQSSQVSQKNDDGQTPKSPFPQIQVDNVYNEDEEGEDSEDEGKVGDLEIPLDSKDKKQEEVEDVQGTQETAVTEVVTEEQIDRDEEQDS